MQSNTKGRRPSTSPMRSPAKRVTFSPSSDYLSSPRDILSPTPRPNTSPTRISKVMMTSTEYNVRARTALNRYFSGWLDHHH